MQNAGGKKQISTWDKITPYKDLFIQLTLREIKAKYKQSLLGYAWVIIVPLVNLLVLSIVFSYFFKVSTGSIPYPIYLFVALVPWIFTANSISFATSSIVANNSLITKIYLPREIFPLAAVAAKFIDLLLTALILAIFLVAFGGSFYLSLIYIPVILLVQLILTVGLAFFLSATNAFFRDIENVLGVFLTMWMYLTPIIYPPELIPSHLQFFFNLNPMAGIINAYRGAIFYGITPFNPSFFSAAAISIMIFVFGYAYFKNRAKYFADVI